MILVCLIVFIPGSMVSGSDENMIRNKYKAYLRIINEVGEALKLGNAGEALTLVGQLRSDWEFQKTEMRKQTDNLMSRALYLEAHALYKSGKKSLVPNSLKRAFSFDKEQKVLYSPLLEYDFFRDVTTLFINSCQGKFEQCHEVTEYFLGDIIFSNPSSENFAVALFRSNDLSQGPVEFSIILLYRRNSEGTYEPSELKVARTKYHTLSLEKDTGNIILRKKFGRTGKTETITVSIKDGLKIISRDRK